MSFSLLILNQETNNYTERQMNKILREITKETSDKISLIREKYAREGVRVSGKAVIAMAVNELLNKKANE